MEEGQPRRATAALGIIYRHLMAPATLCSTPLPLSLLPLSPKSSIPIVSPLGKHREKEGGRDGQRQTDRDNRQNQRGKDRENTYILIPDLGRTLCL